MITLFGVPDLADSDDLVLRAFDGSEARCPRAPARQIVDARLVEVTRDQCDPPGVTRYRWDKTQFVPVEE